MTEPRSRRKNNSPWKRTEKDRGYQRRKAGAAARAAAHVCGPTCKRYRTAAARVWAAVEDDPAFVAGIAAGRADIEAGRVVPWSEVRARP